MSVTYELNAELRTDSGKGASRRLRRTGMVPGIIYGGVGEPISIQVDHDKLFHAIENEAFFSHVLDINIKGEKEPVEAVMKDLQRHPFKPVLMHFDLYRITRGQKMRVSVPLHFVGDDKAPATKEGGVLSRQMTEVELNVLPREIPEYIEVDVSELNIGDALRLTDLKLPESGELIAFNGLDEDEIEAHDQSIVHFVVPRVEVEEPADGEDVAADEVPSIEQEAGDPTDES